MGQPRTINWGEAQVGLEKVWRCRCWDCMAHRRHVLRKVALLVVLLGVSCGWAIETGAGKGGAEDEITVVGGGSGLSWF
jgi:hypothetical protein